MTSGLHSGFSLLSAQDGSVATASYEARKCSFLNTAALCKEEGIVFRPMVIEAVGGSWGTTARDVFSRFANSSARLTGESPSQKLEDCLTHLSVVLHRANAHATLVRSPPAGASCPRDVCPASACARAGLIDAELRRRAMVIDR